MTNQPWNETLIERKVTYMLEVNGNLLIIENAPARVNVETGENFFLPETVERLQKTIWEKQKPARMIDTPVFEFAM